MTKLEWPRDGQYIFGPLLVRVDLIEPFIMSNARIGLAAEPDKSFLITFESDKDMEDFIHIISLYPDQFPERSRSLDDLKAEVESRRAHDEFERCESRR